MAACMLVSMTFKCKADKGDLHFWRAMACTAIRSVVDRGMLGGGKRYVASVMLRGRIGCVPVAAK